MRKKILRDVKWQAPSNGRIFDQPFDEKKNDKYMNDRTFGVLDYIYEKKPTFNQIKKELQEYLHDKFPNHPKNKSCLSHFLNNPLFYGLIDEYPSKKGKRYLLTIDGLNMLENYKMKKWKDVLESFIICLMRVKYTNNKATNRTRTPSLFPFRIIFFLMKKYGKLGKSDFESWIPFIKTQKDLNRENFNFINNEKKYNKIRTWVVSTLVQIKIFSYENFYYSLNNEYDFNSVIDNFISNEDFLFDVEAKYRNKRNLYLPNELKEEIKKISDYKCWINNLHKLDTKSNNKPILHIHHIIPYEMKESFKSLTINSMDNLIAICPSCHNIIHWGKIESVKKICNIIFQRKSIFLKKYLNSVDDLVLLYKRLFNSSYK